MSVRDRWQASGVERLREFGWDVAANAAAVAVVAVVVFVARDLTTLLAGLLALSVLIAASLALHVRRRGRAFQELKDQLAATEAECDSARTRADHFRQRAEAEAGFRAMDEQLYSRVVDGSLRLLRGESVDTGMFAGLGDETQAEFQKAAERVVFEQALRARMSDTAAEN
jgi:hypothetical protein